MASLIRRSEQTESPSAWEPFRLMRDLMSWDPFAEMFPTVRQPLASRVFAPSFEVKETADAYVFRADLPGVDENDLDITLTGNRLTVSGKREAEDSQESDTYYAHERAYGSFSRSFTLPDGADVDHADAALKNGVLVVSIPKKAEHQPRKIALRGQVKGALGGKEKGNA